MMFVLALIVLAAVGCGEKQAIVLLYDRQPQYHVSASIKKLAIAEFGGQSSGDKAWGEMAADKLASALDEYNKKFHRYELVDRMRLRAIVDERDLQTMISNPNEDSARKVGQIAKVDAMVYGTVRTFAKDEHLTRSAFDPIRRTTKTVPYIRRSCTVSVSFFMDDIGTSKVIAAVQSEHSFDSDKQKQTGGGAVASMMGMGGTKLPPTDEITSGLLDQCVEDFLAKVSPHQVRVEVVPENGKSKAVGNGNQFAYAGEYKDALECYLDALNAKPDDYGAAFNAGIAYEAMGNLEKAYEYYDKACRMKTQKKFIMARKRVRAESEQIVPPASAPKSGYGPSS